MGNGQGLVISSLGLASFVSPYNCHTTLSLNNLLLVPHIAKNLVSVSKFAQDNYVFFEFHPKCCFVKSVVSRQILLKGTLGSDGLYCFENLNLLKPSFAALSHKLVSKSINSNSAVVLSNSVNTSNSSYTLWHNRLGHAHFTAVNNVLDLCKIPHPNKEAMEFCNASCYGKSHLYYKHM